MSAIVGVIRLIFGDSDYSEMSLVNERITKILVVSIYICFTVLLLNLLVAMLNLSFSKLQDESGLTLKMERASLLITTLRETDGFK